jgi:anthranilate phosphoribosyltransferase
MVVHGEDGLDEITTTATTHAAIVRGAGGLSAANVETRTLDSVDHGVARGSLAALQVADLEGAAAMFRSVLAGEKTPAREIVLINAAAALVVGGAAGSLREGVALAADAVDRGDAGRVMGELVKAAR